MPQDLSAARLFPWVLLRVLRLPCLSKDQQSARLSIHGAAQFSNVNLHVERNANCSPCSYLVLTSARKSGCPNAGRQNPGFYVSLAAQMTARSDGILRSSRPIALAVHEAHQPGPASSPSHALLTFKPPIAPCLPYSMFGSKKLL